ncbi:putative beta propeller protein [Leishmania major strain Friedlin]|uniref:Putative beta propeller protein n=1 Tax=Leishmania major TaxID=5664 RepID=Q4QBH3_LEIMA|nr:putative beta propeller protein [Leishmania major strain Friedlin]CAJ03819.1 putative beta propeller protein [Leishmania major strain Friedlin]|eukprot:XP_001683325.1 putative beta propeller protein [Leishmania major strain Friedlin]
MLLCSSTSVFLYAFPLLLLPVFFCLFLCLIAGTTGIVLVSLRSVDRTTFCCSAHTMSADWTLPLRKVPVHATKDPSVAWNTVHLCYEQTFFGQITSLRYNHAGSLLGGTSTNQFALLRVPQTDGVVVNEQTERKNYSVRFREDDKLYIQAVDQRVVLRSSETAFERQYLGHSRDVRSAIFIGRHNFASASDDTTVKLWDLMSDDDLGTARIHTDYVRCLEPYAGGSFFSGSYDHRVNLWDPRTGMLAPLQTSGDSITQAVEALCFVPSEEIVAVGAGDRVVVFDPRKGLSTPLFQGSFHTKSVVAVAYSQKLRSLLTGSLDCRVKMFSLEGSELRCISNKRFENGVTSLAVHPGSTEYAVGSTTGELNVYRFREAGIEEDDAPEELVLDKEKTRSKEQVLQDKMKEVQFQLRSYQYGKALKTALYSRHPDVLVSTFEELVRRGALHVALNNQNDRTIVRVLRFATHYVEKPQFTDTMLVVFETIFDIYSAYVGKSAFFHREILNAQKKIGASLAVIQRMERSMGIMEMIVHSE